ncbi:MAG: HXXEE domain-containing protein [Actinomycetota bacterium]|nr:HXXEE domain-containing protein [Actinomycetota bacterium]
MERHWFDVGGVLGLILAAVLGFTGSSMSTLSLLLWISLLSLLAHQVEEWRRPGWFPGMLNVVLFRSADPWRFPLNVRSGLAVNVGVGWVGYVLAALLAERALWLALATITVSIGNCVLHLAVIPMRGRMPYNPGMATSLVLFLPISAWFLIGFWSSMSLLDVLLGLAVGLALNVGGVVGLIRVMESPSAPPFEARQVEPALRFVR